MMTYKLEQELARCELCSNPPYSVIIFVSNQHEIYFFLRESLGEWRGHRGSVQNAVHLTFGELEYRIPCHKKWRVYSSLYSCFCFLLLTELRDLGRQDTTRVRTVWSSRIGMVNFLPGQSERLSRSFSFSLSMVVPLAFSRSTTLRAVGRCNSQEKWTEKLFSRAFFSFCMASK